MNIPVDFATQVYNTPRAEGETDLVSLVRGCIKDYYAEELVVDYYDKHPIIIQAADKNSTVQKLLLNRYWSQILLGVPNSQGARCQLVSGGEITLWFKLFSEGVLPFVASNDVLRKVY